MNPHLYGEGSGEANDVRQQQSNSNSKDLPPMGKAE
jgi:hypothetical protein